VTQHALGSIVLISVPLTGAMKYSVSSLRGNQREIIRGYMRGRVALSLGGYEVHIP
jgi:hypothetical protein